LYAVPAAVKLWHVVQSRPALWLVRLAPLLPTDDDVLVGEVLGEAGELPPQAVTTTADPAMRAHTKIRMRPSPARLDPVPVQAESSVRGL
jgi:hypothetical protein